MESFLALILLGSLLAIAAVVLAIFLIRRDLARRQQVQEERDRFFTLSLDLLCIAGFDGYFKRLNPAWEKTLGYAQEELLARPFVEFVHPEDRESTLAAAQQLAGGEVIVSFENRYRCKDGTYKWLLWNAAAHVGQQLIYAAARDITERKQVEEKLELDVRLQQVRVELLRLQDKVWRMERAEDIEGVLSSIGVILKVKGISFLAYSINLVEEPEGELPIQAYLHDFKGQRFQGALKRDQPEGQVLLESWDTREIRYRPDLARENIYGEHLNPLPGYERVRSVIDVPFSRGTLALASAQPEAFSAADIALFKEIAQIIEGGFQRQEDLQLLEERQRALETEIAERKQAEEGLRQALCREEAMSRVRSRIIAIRHIGDMREELEVAWVDELRDLGIPVEGVSLQRPVGEGQFFSCSIFNRNFRSWQEAEVGIADFPKLEEFPWVKEAWESGNPVVFDRRGLDQSGKVGPEIQSLLEVPLPGEGSIGLNSLRRDAFGPEAVRTVQLFSGLITEGLRRLRDVEALRRTNQSLEEAHRKLKESQSHLVQSEKMASLGQLVAGIAHEINNPLAFVANNLFTSQEGLERLAQQAGLAGAPAERLAKIRKRLAEAGEGVNRVAELVRKLRTFSRLDQGQFKLVDIHESLDAVLLFLHHKMKERIQVEKHYGPHATLFCTGELNQVLMNLVANAVDAIEGEGKISLATGQRDGIFFISVKDTGKGIPAAIQERIFEPFFTTKPVGQGTGLGLAIAHSIVQAHQGRIEVHSQEGQGAEMVVEIPLDLEARTGELVADN